MLNKISLIALGCLSVLALPGIAHGQTVRVSETTSTGGSRNVIYVKGLTAGSSATLAQTGALTNSARLPDSCGMLKLTKPSAGWSGNITVNGTAVTISSLSVVTPPTCTGGTLTPAQTTNFKDASDNVYIVGLTANTAVTVGLPRNTTRTANANGCGIATFRESTSSPWSSTSTMTINGTAVTFGNITSQMYAPYCRNVGTSASPSYVRYEPSN